jgi:hypothetical protein
MLAHDVRSPLGVVLGHAQMIREGLVSGGEHAASGVVLARQVDRMRSMCDTAVADMEVAMSHAFGRFPVAVRPGLGAALRGFDGEGRVSGAPDARIWDRGGSWDALIERLSDPILGPWSHAGITVGPGRVVVAISYVRAEAPAALAGCGRPLRVLGAAAVASEHVLRVELPGDDGRLAVAVDARSPRAASVAAALRAAGVRTSDDPALSDVVLVVAERGGAPPSYTPGPTLVFGSGAFAPGDPSAPPRVPESVAPERLVRLLRTVAGQPDVMDLATGAALIPPSTGGVCVPVRVEAGDRHAASATLGELVRAAMSDSRVHTVVRREGGADVWAETTDVVASLLAQVRTRSLGIGGLGYVSEEC